MCAHEKCVEQENLAAVVAGGGIEGLRILEENKDSYSLIILDIMMPVIFTLIGGYLINREYTDDTLKNIFVIPVSFSKLLTGELTAMSILSLILGMYSFVVTIIVGIFAGFPGHLLS